MTYNHNPFQPNRTLPGLNAQVIFSKYDKSKVKVKIDSPDIQWYVHWGDDTYDQVSPGVHEVIHQYSNTRQGATYEVRVSKGNQVQLERIGY